MELTGNAITKVLEGRNMLLLQLFVVLNLADAQLTKILLSMGGQEMCFWGMPYNTNLYVKTIVPLSIAIALVLFGKSKLLVWLNACMVVIVLMHIVMITTWWCGYAF